MLHCGAGRVVTRSVDREFHSTAREVGLNHAVGIWYALGDLSGRLSMEFHPACSVAMDLSGLLCCGGYTAGRVK